MIHACIESARTACRCYCCRYAMPDKFAEGREAYYCSNKDSPRYLMCCTIHCKKFDFGEDEA